MLERFRIVPTRRKLGFGVGALSRLVERGNAETDPSSALAMPCKAAAPSGPAGGCFWTKAQAGMRFPFSRARRDPIYNCLDVWSSTTSVVRLRVRGEWTATEHPSYFPPPCRSSWFS